MSFAGGKMQWGKGYRTDKSDEPAPQRMSDQGGGGEEESGDPTEAIHQHLQKMHGMTGHGHSHIEHKPEGHMAHHVDHDGNVSGPEPTEDCPGGMCGGGM